MKQWKVPMPKPAPGAGKVHFAMASKMVNGARAELHAEFSEVKARLMWKLSQMSDDQIAKTIGLDAL